MTLFDQAAQDLRAHAALAEFDRLHRENQRFIEQATADLLAHGIDIRPRLLPAESEKGGGTTVFTLKPEV